MNKTTLAILLSLWAAAPAPVLAQTDADRATARSLAEKGQDALERRDFRSAEDHFARADALVHAPTLLLGVARARAGLGKLVEAHEAFARILREGVLANAPAAFREAAIAAGKELDELAPRIPTLTITVSGPSDAEITLDGAPLPRAALGVPRPVNPGARVVRATARGFLPADKTLEVAEKASATAELTLAPDPGKRPDTRAPLLARDAVSLGLLGAGAGALGAFAASGLIALDSLGELETTCRDGRCPSTDTTRIGAFERERAFSLGSLGVGVAAAGAGVALLATTVGAPGAPATKKIASAAFGLGAAGLVVGGVAGALSLSQRGDLDAACPADVCPAREAGALDSHRALGIVSIAGLVTAGVGAGAGTVLWWSDGWATVGATPGGLRVAGAL